MRVLIVGCGYVGSALGAVLVKAGHEVFGMRRSAGTTTGLNEAGIQFLAADVAKPETLARLPLDFDWVVNCVSSSGGDAEDYRRAYLEGTRNLVAWLAESGIKRFVYTSSTSVYGQTDGSLVDETSPAEPSEETARILVETEQTLFEAARSGFPSVVLRVAGIYGPGRGYWFRQLAENKARIEGRGDRILNMIHRDDVAGAIIAALGRGQPGEVYNVVDDEPVSQLDFFRTLSALLGKPLPAFAEGSEVAARGKRGRTNKRISNSRLKTELGYHFMFPSFRQGWVSVFAKSC